MIGENDWDRIDDEIFKLRKLLKKIKDQWTI